MQLPRVMGALVVVALAAWGSGCTTVIKPTRPSDPLVEVAEIAGIRFDGEHVELREVGMPLSSSRAWEREVRNYAASSLNELLATEADAPSVETIVVFDLAGPSAVQIGAWKEMTIELTTTLPSGQVVRSEPVTENIDDPIEHFLVNGMTVCGSALDVVAGIASLMLMVSYLIPPLSGLFPYACGCFIGSAILGLTLHVGERFGAYLVAGSEERRWSNLFADALTQHAQDIEAALAKAPLAPSARPPSRPAPAPGGPPDELGAPPPPPVLDPADEAPPAAAPAPGGSTAF